MKRPHSFFFFKKSDNKNWVLLAGLSKSILKLVEKIHLAYYIFEIELGAIAIHIGQPLTLLLEKELKFVASNNPIII